MLNDEQLNHFRERFGESLMDVCHILTYSRPSSDDYGEPTDTWTDTAIDIPCGLEQQSGEEQQRDKETVVSYDAIIRFSLGIDLDVKDRIKITERFGEAITPIIYEVASPQQRGPAGVRYLLKKINV